MSPEALAAIYNEGLGQQPPWTNESGYALADLVAGWSLAAGPAQTLSSAGVVSGGPADLVTFGSGITFDGSWCLPGAAFSDVESPSASDLLQAVDATTPLLVSAEYEIIAWDSSHAHPLVNCIGNNYGEPFDLHFNILYGGGGATPNVIGFSRSDDNLVYAEAHVAAPTSGVHHVLGWWDPLDQSVHMSLDGGATADGTAPGGFTVTADPGVYFQGFQGNADTAKNKLRRWRVWAGPGAAALAADANFRRWLAEGRTDTELAAVRACR